MMNFKISYHFTSVIFILTLLCVNMTPVRAQEEDSGAPDPLELAEKTLEKLTDDLKLEDWQVFYLDSTLCHDYTEWFAEMEKLQKSGAENTNLYLAVKDKWMIRIEEAYKKFLTPEQWEQYLKEGGISIIKEREKRKARMEAAATKGKNKKNKKTDNTR